MLICHHTYWHTKYKTRAERRTDDVSGVRNTTAGLRGVIVASINTAI